MTIQELTSLLETRATVRVINYHNGQHINGHIIDGIVTIDLARVFCTKIRLVPKNEITEFIESIPLSCTVILYNEIIDMDDKIKIRYDIIQ